MSIDRHYSLTPASAPYSTADHALIERLRAGDVRAMPELYRRHVATARDVALRLTAAPSHAEDLVHDSFLAVFNNISAGAGPDRHFRAYLLTTMRARDGERGELLAFTDDADLIVIMAVRARRRLRRSA